MNFLKSILVVICVVSFQKTQSQDIPSNQIIETNKLVSFLNQDVQESLGGVTSISKATLAQYFREKFAERYFYNWKHFDTRFKSYTSIYPEAKNNHSERALDHLSKFSDSTKWKLPFNYLNGEPVNAYALRHLARQHKMVDIAFYYNYQNKNTDYLNYFKNPIKVIKCCFTVQ